MVFPAARNLTNRRKHAKLIRASQGNDINSPGLFRNAGGTPPRRFPGAGFTDAENSGRGAAPLNMKRVLIHQTRFDSALGGVDFLPLMLIAELQRRFPEHALPSRSAVHRYGQKLERRLAAILGKKVGTTVEVQAPIGIIKYKIMKIKA